MRSLQARLGFGLIVTVVVLFTAQWVVVNVSLRHLTEEYFASRLMHDVEGLLAGLEFDDEGRPVVAVDHADPIFSRPYSGHYYQITSGAQTVHSRSLWDKALTVPPVAVGQHVLATPLGPQDEPLVLMAASYEKRGRVITIAVAEDYSPVEADYRTFQWRYVLITFVVLAGLIIMQVWAVRRGLRPLENVREDVRGLERGETQQLGGDVPAEVAPLVMEINHLLKILRERLDRSRNALGNLAHALKTPLTALEQLLNSDELKAHPQLHAQLRAQSEIIGRYIQRELKRARLAGAATPGQRFDLSGELPSLVTALKQIYRDKGLAIDCTIPPRFSYPAEREDMLELFGNLLDNACKWASRRVMLIIEDRPGLSFSIEDDGPGAPEEKLAQLVERGVRLDESAGGSGLGLAIVRDIVTHYGGEMGLERSPRLGGFRVWIRLPAPGKSL